ncbi:hypothetical protein ACEQ8H_004726 [Pleosporales sp. CAS-2024a]
MKSSMIIASAAALFSTVFAAPHVAVRQATEQLYFVIQVSDDISGANVNVGVPVNAPQASTFGALLAGTDFANRNNGRILASSLMAVTPGVGGGNVRCLYNNALTLSSTTTWIDLDGNPSQAIDVDITNATIECNL